MHSYTQVPLFDLGLNMQSAQEVKLRIMNATFSANTLKAYRCAWEAFERWCYKAGRVSFPASPQDCIDFAAWCIASGFRLQTVHLRLKAITHVHKQRNQGSPCGLAVRQFMRNARRDLRERERGKTALSPLQLRKISIKLSRRGSPVDVRDRAMILITFACGWRRSEIVSIDLRDMRWESDGIVFWLGKSKTDQEGKGRPVGVQYGRKRVTCPLTALREWLDLRGSWEGPLFTGISPSGNVTENRLGDDGVCRAVKRGLDLIGQDPKTFGAHSLRAGMITSAIESGASETSVMQRTGHKCYQTLRRYVRPATVFRANPLKRVL